MVLIGPIEGTDVERAYARKLFKLAMELSGEGEWTGGTADAFIAVLKLASRK